MHLCLSGLFQEDSDPPVSESLGIENTLWAGTVVASGELPGTECVSDLPRERRSSVIMTIIRHLGQLVVCLKVFSPPSGPSGDLNQHVPWLWRRADGGRANLPQTLVCLDGHREVLLLGRVWRRRPYPTPNKAKAAASRFSAGLTWGCSSCCVC